MDVLAVAMKSPFRARPRKNADAWEETEKATGER
jgi:hypothetical protein